MLNIIDFQYGQPLSEIASIPNKDFYSEVPESEIHLMQAPMTRQKRSHLKKYHPHQNSNGKWTKEEQDMLLFALDVFGNNWKAIELFLGSRTDEQIRSHTQKHFSSLRRETIKRLKESNQLKGKRFLITKQYRVNHHRCPLTQAIVKQVKEMRRMYFSLQELQDNGHSNAIKEEFNIPPLGNLSHDDDLYENRNEHLKIEFINAPQIFPRFCGDEVLGTFFSKETQRELFGFRPLVPGASRYSLAAYDGY